MTTAALLLLDLVAAVAATAAWAGAAAMTWPSAASGEPPHARAGRSRWALILTAVAIVAAAAHIVIVLALWGRGWWFAQDQVVLGMPVLAVVTAVTAAVAIPPLVRFLRGVRGDARDVPVRVPLWFVIAASAGGVCVVSRLVVGYPMDPLAVAALLVLMLLAVGLARALLLGAPRRMIVGFAGLGVIAAIAWAGVAWATSLPPGEQFAHAHAARPEPGVATVPITSLRTPADVSGPVEKFELTAVSGEVALASGATVDAWTFDGQVGGVPLTVDVGDVVEATLTNRDVEAGATIHWHGVDLPAGEDGVAGVTQDAVMPGESFRYRFVAEHAGTYWYHTHQVSADGVRRGLYGTLVVEPPGGVPEDVDLVVPMHTFDGLSVFGASDVPQSREVTPGAAVRLRIVNTDDLPLFAQLDGVPFRVVAVDGRDLEGGAEVEGRSIRVPAGGRVDLSFAMPAAPVSLWRDGSAGVGLVLAPEGADATALLADAAPAAATELDLVTYASTGMPFPDAVRHGEAVLVLDRMPRMLGALPAYGYTVNGAVAPGIPAIEVSEGEALALTVVNRGWETHPMHIHGHHVRVVSRDGVAATAGLWLDSFDVQPGEVWVVELFADNPGIWMAHCHNLPHAAEGMSLGLAYPGVSSEFQSGGAHGNRPE